MSQVVYNQISLPYPFTTQFDQSPVYDDVGGVDWCGTDFDIQVQCILNADYINGMSSRYAGANPANAAAVMDLIRVDLLKPRKLLSFQCNGQELIPARAGVPGTVDSDNGPKPQYARVMQLTNDTFLLAYRVKARYWENYSSNINRSQNLPGNDVLFNRWTETVEIDNCLYSQRTREGTYKIRSDNFSGAQADYLRGNMATVGVPQGFTRQSSSYTISPDGLSVRYRVVDREVYKMPPQPAYEAHGVYTETARGGVIVYGDVRLRLKGSKDASRCPQNRLIEVATAIAGQKLGINGAGGLPVEASVSVGMYENTVDVHMKAVCNNSRARIENTSLGNNFNANMCFTPRSEDGTPPPEYSLRGSACFLLEAARYYDPSLRGTQMGLGQMGVLEQNIPVGKQAQLTNGLPIGTAGVIREA